MKINLVSLSFRDLSWKIKIMILSKYELIEMDKKSIWES